MSLSSSARESGSSFSTGVSVLAGICSGALVVVVVVVVEVVDEVVLRGACVVFFFVRP